MNRDTFWHTAQLFGKITKELREDCERTVLSKNLEITELKLFISRLRFTIRKLQKRLDSANMYCEMYKRKYEKLTERNLNDG